MEENQFRCERARRGVSRVRRPEEDAAAAAAAAAAATRGPYVAS